MKINREFLEERDACEDGIYDFIRIFGDVDVELNAENLSIAVENNLDVALIIGYLPETDDIRAAMCLRPRYAYDYAKHVDKGPHDDTRTAACKCPYTAYLYATYVDKGPREDTRAAACKNPTYAHLYARYVDEGAK